MLTECTIILITFVIGLIIYYKWSFQYWKRKCVPTLSGPTFPFGNMENPFSRRYFLGDLIKKYYDEAKAKGYKHVGIYNFFSPVYLPIDPEYFKLIMQTDFQYFSDHGWYYNEKDDPLSAHLFAIGGQKWRNLRAKLTPVFTSGKMKIMFDTLLQCGEQMETAVDKFYENHEPIDIKDLVARYTTDIIGSCAFGLECNSCKNPDADFRRHGKNVFAPVSKLKAVKHIFANAKPELAKFFGVTMLPKESTTFFFNIVKETIDFRQRSNLARNDMLQIAMDLQNSSLTIEEIAAQSFIFFLAGFETSSTTMSFCMFELATNLEIQERVRKEINEVIDRYGGRITYDSLEEMKYLTQVIKETLRKYPPLSYVNRKCVQNYTIPNTNIEIEKGTLLFLSILGLHRDPEYFPEPEKFDPERFSPENKEKILPFTYMPFGEGPRICIGLRFGWMQTKLGLITLLKNYKFTLNEKTQTPLEIDRFTLIILTSKGGIWLNMEKV